MLHSYEGKKVPQVTFKTRTPDTWVQLTSGEIFDGKTVVVFSLPGAFTPTCSSAHVPRYEELAPVFKANGVDDPAALPQAFRDEIAAESGQKALDSEGKDIEATDYSALSESALWEEYRKVLAKDGRDEASAFYGKHMKRAAN